MATININPQPNAGTDGATTICDSSTASIDLFGLITGEQAGGTWTRLTGTGGTFNAATGTFVPAPGTTTSTFQYSLTAIAPCINDVSVATVNINPQPNAGTDGATTICDSSTASIDLFGLITGEQTGGTWTRLTGTGGTFNAAAGIFVPAPGTTTSTFQYFLPGTAPCINDVSVATVNINPQPNAGTDGATTICDSSTASIDLFGLITGEQTGGTWTRLTGTGGTFNAAAGIFVPAPGTTTSTFQYFLPGTAPCINDVSVATVNINPQPNAGTDGATTICDSNTASIDLFGLITGEQTGGTWTRLSGTGGTFNAAAGTFVPAPGTTTSTFQYSLTAITPCIDDVSVATVNINPQPNAGADGATTICDSNTESIDLFSLITGEQAGGTWTRLTGTGGTFNAAAGTYVPAPGSTSSTFQYFMTGTAPCVNDVSVATININPQPNAGADGATTICDSNTASIDLFSLITGEQAGGTWTRLSGTGGTFNASAGTFVPAPGTTTSTFQYSLTAIAPCINDVSVATVNINPQPNAGTDGATTICDSNTASIDLFSLITGEQTGGTWTRLTGTGGTFNAAAGTFVSAVGATSSTFQYSLTGTAPCINDVSVATITINPQPNVVATPASRTICSGSATGIVLSSAVAGTTYAWTVVQTGVTGATNGTGGSISQVLTTTGLTAGTAVYTIIPTANGCTGLPIVVTIIVNPIPVIFVTPTSESICSGQLTTIALNSNIVGTTYSWTVTQAGVSGATAGSGNTISQVLTATGSAIGTATYTVTPMFNGCSGSPVSVTITVTPGAIISATATATSICSGERAVINLGSSLPGTTYNWNVIQNTVTGATSGTGTSISQVLTVAGNLPGQATYTITPVTNGCLGTPISITITVNPIPVVKASPLNQTVCSGTATNIVLISNVPNTTFTWNVIQTGVYGAASGTGNSITQTLSTVSLVQGTVDYIITPHTNGCAGMPVTVTVLVNPMPEVFGDPSETVICSGDSAEFALFPNIPGTTFTWTVEQNGVTGASDGSGNANPLPVSQVLETTGNTPGTVTYTITPSANGCIGTPITIEFTVNPLPQPQLQHGSICVDPNTGSVLSTHTLDTGLNNTDYDFVWFFNGEEISGATSNTYVADQQGDYSVLVSNSLTGCVSHPVEVTVTESHPAQALNLYVNEAFSNDPTITAVVTGGSGNFEYQLDGGAYQASNVFTGVLQGLHVVHVVDVEGCTDLIQNIFVIDYPRFFTPNGDGYNETWNIWDLKDQPNAEIFIFDRYGKLIKQIATTGEGWDGTYNGHPLPSTDYWFTVKFKDGVNKEDRIFKAHFSMKR
ncbi:hypothetical protein Q767_15635 [Flavobacterium enshiense DK69]|uniref:PKD-like domain-containing protein n=1 Tax=Flavobacterium enshiense DK69 TaxID=1107311 RepID=A0A0A2MLU4_9FLAO|nr:hypothetical protein Q767_15635 [Flavobacterium enshiense DK69]